MQGLRIFDSYKGIVLHLCCIQQEKCGVVSAQQKVGGGHRGQAIELGYSSLNTFLERFRIIRVNSDAYTVLKIVII